MTHPSKDSAATQYTAGSLAQSVPGLASENPQSSRRSLPDATQILHPQRLSSEDGSEVPPPAYTITSQPQQQEAMTAAPTAAPSNSHRRTREDYARRTENRVRKNYVRPFEAVSDCVLGTCKGYCTVGSGCCSASCKTCTKPLQSIGLCLIAFACCPCGSIVSCCCP